MPLSGYGPDLGAKWAPYTTSIDEGRSVFKSWSRQGTRGGCHDENSITTIYNIIHPLTLMIYNPAAMFISLSTILLSLVPALTSANVLRTLDRREDICGTTGFANSATSYFQSSNEALASYTGCSSRCAADTRCKSFGYSGTVCMLYESPLSASLAQYAQSDIVYYDARCAGVHGGLAASSTSEHPRPLHSHTGTALPWTVTQTLMRSHTTITRTRTMSKVGPAPTSSVMLSLMPFPIPARSTVLSAPNCVSNMDNGHKIPRGESSSPTGNAAVQPAPTTMVTQVTPVPVAQADRTTPLGRSNWPDITDHKPTTFSGPTATFAVPRASGSARACADGGVAQPWPAVATVTATNNKRWFWPFAGLGSPRPGTPGGAPNGTIPAGFDGCYPRTGQGQGQRFSFGHVQ